MNELWRLDLELFRRVNIAGHSPWLDPLFFVLSSTGLGWLQALVVLVIGWRFKGLFLQERWPLIACIVLSGLVTSGLPKKLIPRDRPSNLLEALPQEGFFLSSFPSGHTTTSFAVAAYLLFCLAGTSRARWGWVALGWALLVGISRVYRGVHWPSDVLAGAFAGLLTAALIRLVVLARRKDQIAA